MTLLGFVEVQAQNVLVRRVEEIKMTTNYEVEQETEAYKSTLKEIKEYETDKLAQVKTIEEAKNMSSNKEVTEDLVRNIIEFMKSHQLQTAIKDQAVDWDNLSKSDFKKIRKQIEKYGSIQIIGWDESVSSSTPISDEYKDYLKSKNKLEKFENGTERKMEMVDKKSPEFLAEIIIEIENHTSTYDTIPVIGIQNVKEYYTSSYNKVSYSDSSVIVYDVSQEKYATSDLEKYHKGYDKTQPYLVFEYEGKKYAMTPKEYDIAKKEEQIFKYLPKGIDLYYDNTIASDAFKIDLAYENRREQFAKKGAVLTTMLNDIEKGSKQIIGHYSQFMKYNNQLNEFAGKFARYRGRVSSKEKSAFLAALGQVEKINNEVKKIKDNLEKKYELDLSKRFYVFVKDGEYEDPDKVASNITQLKNMLSYF